MVDLASVFDKGVVSTLYALASGSRSEADGPARKQAQAQEQERTAGGCAVEARAARAAARAAAEEREWALEQWQAVCAVPAPAELARMSPRTSRALPASSARAEEKRPADAATPTET